MYTLKPIEEMDIPAQTEVCQVQPGDTAGWIAGRWKENPGRANCAVQWNSGGRPIHRGRKPAHSATRDCREVIGFGRRD